MNNDLMELGNPTNPDYHIEVVIFDSPSSSKLPPKHIMEGNLEFAMRVNSFIRKNGYVELTHKLDSEKGWVKTENKGFVNFNTGLRFIGTCSFDGDMFAECEHKDSTKIKSIYKGNLNSGFYLRKM